MPNKAEIIRNSFEDLCLEFFGLMTQQDCQIGCGLNVGEFHFLRMKIFIKTSISEIRKT